MAGCSQCADTCNCNVVDELGNPYGGTGTPTNPFVIPRAQNTKWQGTSPDGSIIITEGDVVPANDDGHAPTLEVDWCLAVEDTEVTSGNLLVTVDGDDDCRPKRLRDPLPGEFLGQGGDGEAAWVQGAVISNGAVPLGVPLEFWGSESSVPAGYVLCAGQLVAQTDYPLLFAVIQHNANAGVEPAPGMFRIPDRRGNVAVGRDDMGGASANRITAAWADVLDGSTNGSESHVLTTPQIPGHTHPLAINNAATGVSVNGTTTAISVNNAATGVSILGAGDHFHYPGSGASRGFVTFNDPPLNVLIANDTPDTINLIVSNADLAQKNNAATSNDGFHAHGTSDPTHGHTTNNPAHGHTTNDPTHGHTGTATTTGGGQAHPNIQPSVAANYIMRAA